MIDLIYTRDEKLYICKQSADWQTWQKQFADYMTHLTFGSIQECLDFLQDEYALSADAMASLAEPLEHSLQICFEITIYPNKTINIEKYTLTKE